MCNKAHQDSGGFGLRGEHEVDLNRKGNETAGKDKVQAGNNLSIQQKELEQTIQYEMKMEDIRKNNEVKMKAQKEKELQKKK